MLKTKDRNQETSSMRAMKAQMLKAAGAVIAAGVTLASPMPMLAHHAFAAEFDENKPVKFTDATVTKVQLINPHSWIYVDVKMPNGATENWAIEAGTPNVLFRRGFTKQTLLPGTEIVIDGYRSKDGSRRANGRDLTFADGKKLFLGSSGTGAPYELSPGAK